MEKQWKQWLTLFWGSKITADGDCSHEIKRHLLLGRKIITNLDSILKIRQHIKNQRHYFVNKGPSSQGYVFPVVMYGCESWCRIDAFELWCWRRVLRVKIHKFNQPQISDSGENFFDIVLKQQNLNLQHPSNYLHSIYTVLGITGNQRWLKYIRGFA